MPMSLKLSPAAVPLVATVAMVQAAVKPMARALVAAVPSGPNEGPERWRTFLQARGSGHGQAMSGCSISNPDCETPLLLIGRFSWGVPIGELRMLIGAGLPLMNVGKNKEGAI